VRTSIDSYTSGANITPDDDVIIATTKAVMVSATGDLAVEMEDGSQITITDAIVGKDYRIAVRKVLEATTATGVIALY
jgi:hypothetical protein